MLKVFVAWQHQHFLAVYFPFPVVQLLFSQQFSHIASPVYVGHSNDSVTFQHSVILVGLREHTQIAISPTHGNYTILVRDVHMFDQIRE